MAVEGFYIFHNMVFYCRKCDRLNWLMDTWVKPRKLRSSDRSFVQCRCDRCGNVQNVWMSKDEFLSLDWTPFV